MHWHWWQTSRVDIVSIEDAEGRTTLRFRHAIRWHHPLWVIRRWRIGRKIAFEIEMWFVWQSRFHSWDFIRYIKLRRA